MIGKEEMLDDWLDHAGDPWIRDFNDMIRNIIFADPILMQLMKIPDKTSVIEFIDRYFIRAGYTNTILSNESVRIVYGTFGVPSNNPDVSKNILSFDIYVKNEDMHNVGRDRLQLRTQLIARRLTQLLTDKRYNGVYRFYEPHESDMGTSAIGYARYNLSMSFMRTH